MLSIWSSYLHNRDAIGEKTLNEFITAKEIIFLAFLKQNTIAKHGFLTANIFKYIFSVSEQHSRFRKQAIIQVSIC